MVTCADIFAGRSAGHALWELTTNGMIFGAIIFVFGELQHALAQQQCLAQHDPLTDLANRSAFYEQTAGELSRCRRYGHPLTIAYLDCDNFKAINDRLGHQTGDTLLCTVATILQRSVRTSDIAPPTPGIRNCLTRSKVLVTRSEMGRAQQRPAIERSAEE